MNLDVKVIELHPGFTAFDVSFDPNTPWPFPCRFHKMTTGDLSDPHDHPFSIHSWIVAGGGYEEEIFYRYPDGRFWMERHQRLPGTLHLIPAKRIHRITRLFSGEVWTIVLTGSGEGPWRQWRIEGDRLL